MAPQSPVLHETVLEEHLLAHLDVSSGKHHSSGSIRGLLGDRWSVRVGQDRDIGQNREANDHYEDGRVSPPRREPRRVGRRVNHDIPPSIPTRISRFPVLMAGERVSALTQESIGAIILLDSDEFKLHFRTLCSAVVCASAPGECRGSQSKSPCLASALDSISSCIRDVLHVHFASQRCRNQPSRAA